MNTELNNVRIEILRKFGTQSDFAAAAGLHESKISQVMRGRRKLSKEQSKQWAKLLECDPVVLAAVTH